MTIGLILIICTLAAALFWCLLAKTQPDRADADHCAPIPAHVPKARTRKRYDRAVCADCGKNVALRADGEPHNRHKCHIPEPKGDAA